MQRVIMLAKDLRESELEEKGSDFCVVSFVCVCLSYYFFFIQT